jgi:hypothetical protein
MSLVINGGSAMRGRCDEELACLVRGKRRSEMYEQHRGGTCLILTIASEDSILTFSEDGILQHVWDQSSQRYTHISPT